MRTTFAIFFILISSVLSFGQSNQDEMIKLWRDIGRFEKEVPFFTKSKLSIFFNFSRKDLNGAFYGVYLNDSLIKTGVLDIRDAALEKMVQVGNFPVKHGKSSVKLVILKDKTEIQKTFEIEVPEFRMVAVEFLVKYDKITDIKIVPRAWLIE